MNKTIEYYNKNAERFTSETQNAEMTQIQNRFLSYVSLHGTILDFGCGSGRDSKYFLDKGYSVVSVDGSHELCKIASENTGQEVICCTFQDYKPTKKFDGIWACASLLHLKKNELKSVLLKLVDSLNQNGCLYLSFKYGSYSGERNGRFFTDLCEEELDLIMSKISGIRKADVFITNDVRIERANEKWLNAFYVKINDI